MTENYGGFMKKIVVLFAVLATSLCIFLASCETTGLLAFADGFDAGAGGWSYVGSASSVTDCSNKSASAGYNYYRFNSELGACYGKN